MSCLTFERVASSSVGFKTDNIAEMNDRRSRLSAQTRLLSDRLEGQGIPAYDQTQTMFTIGEVTGDIERINGRYRHIQLLPEVAQKDRSSMVKALTYFMQNHHARRFFRYAVLTAGERCEFGGNLKEKRQRHYANVRRWANEIRDRFGIVLLYRGAEFTFSAEGVHDHDNVVYWPTRKLSAEEWSDFLTFTRQRLGGVWWKDCGRLNDVREVVKYICKLTSDKNDTESYGIDMLSASQLAWFHRETYRSKLSQPLGPFADFLSELEQSREKIARMRLRDGSTKLVRMSKEPKPKRTNERTAGRQDAENVVVGRTLPFAGSSGVIETHSLVLGYTESPTTLCGKSGLHLIECNKKQAQGWADVNARREALYIVHNSTPSVQTLEDAPFIKPDRNVLMRRYRLEKQRKQEANKPKVRPKPRRAKILTSEQVRQITGQRAKKRFPRLLSDEEVRALGFGFRS